MRKKIYFTGSISGGRKNADIYYEMIQYLKKDNNVLTEHVGNKKLTHFGENNNTDEYIYNRDIKWLESADVLIAEVTTPSLGVGFEIAKATSFGKKILCLYKNQDDKKLSAMIAGCPDVSVGCYKTLDEAINFIKNFLKD